MPSTLLGRSRWSHREARAGSVETITSSNPCMLSASSTAATGSCEPIIPATSEPAALPSSGQAVSMTSFASRQPWSSGSTTL